MTAPDVNDVRARFEAWYAREYPAQAELADEGVDEYREAKDEALAIYRAALADMAGDPRSESGNAEKVAQWLYANEYREAAATIRTQLDVRNKRIADLSGEVRELVEELHALYRAYVRTLEAGMDRIASLGGECDSVEYMERNDPALAKARAALAKFTQEKP